MQLMPQVTQCSLAKLEGTEAKAKSAEHVAGSTTKDYTHLAGKAEEKEAAHSATIAKTLDISQEIVRKAKAKAERHGTEAKGKGKT